MPNSFETGERKVIPAVLVYLFKGEEVLMIHRKGVMGAADFHQGKWNGLGGKCELDESPVEAARREILEEAGVELPHHRFEAMGVLQFPRFKPHREEDWVVFVFSARIDDVDAGAVLKDNREGQLHWVHQNDLLALELWEGDRHFIPWVLEGRPFLGTFWYREGRLSRHSMMPMGK